MILAPAVCGFHHFVGLSTGNPIISGLVKVVPDKNVMERKLQEELDE
jgi:hypothetical protein